MIAKILCLTLLGFGLVQAANALGNDDANAAAGVAPKPAVPSGDGISRDNIVTLMKQYVVPAIGNITPTKFTPSTTVPDILKSFLQIINLIKSFVCAKK